MKYRNFYLAVLVFFISAFLRLVDLDKNPNGFFVDEAVTGYNSWSIAETGKDEYGKSFPLAFRFFGTYTPALYTYLTAVIFLFIDPTVYSTRLVSALSGILFVCLVYFFIRFLKISNNKWLPLFAALLAAISPWDIFYSRTGYETHLAFFLYALAVFCCWLSLSKKIFLLPGFFFFALSINTYQAEKLLVPLTILSFLIVFRKNFLIKKDVKFLILSFFIFLIFSLPQLLVVSTPAFRARATSDGVFYSKAIKDRSDLISFIPKTLSYPLAFVYEFSSQYFNYFSPNNLFLRGDPILQQSIPETSNLYPIWIILFILGLYEIKKIEKTALKFIILLLILAPIPAALASSPFSSQRSLPLLLPLIFILTLGVKAILKIRNKKIGILIALILIFSPIPYLYRSYFVLLPNERARVWGFGEEKLAEEIRKRPYENFLIDNSRFEPIYVPLAFYLKIPPEVIQKSVDQRIKDNYYFLTDWEQNYKFSNLDIRSLEWKKDICKRQIMIGDELTISERQAKEHYLEKVFTIVSPINEIIFVGFKTNPEKSCKVPSREVTL